MILLIGSYIALIVIASILGYKQNGNWIMGLFSALIAAIPGLYSLIPPVREKWYALNARKDIFTDRTFTDRNDDFKIVIEKLILPDHILEIKGKDEQCGKTWLAKRLCDYINYPKAKINADIKIKCPYKRAFYLDMNQWSEKEITNLFRDNLINSKTVLIFDHVTDLDLLLTKQSQFHFQLVYIMKKSDSRGFLTHTISDFNVEHVGELHQKIRKNYSGLSELTEKEINILYKLTNGNIGKISALLSEERCVRWIKDIGNNTQTEYDEKIYQIQTTLYAGQYNAARKELVEFEKEYQDRFNENNDLYYKYILILSDCEHLLNHYEDALSILSIAENMPYTINSDSEEIELHKAHYFKHLWKSNEALEILQKMKRKSYSAIVDSLGILLAKYFINDLYVPESENNSLEEFFNFYLLAQNSSLKHNDDETSKLKRCTPIYNFYKTHPSDNKELIKQIDEVISIYRAQHNRLLANALFIKGELLRLYEDYEGAITNYEKCLDVTVDNNILVQVNLIVYYLQECKHLHTPFKLMDMSKMLDICQHNHYAEQVYQKIRCIKLQDSNFQEIQKCFENRIMPIL